MRLSLNESSELAAQDCLHAMSRHLPPATMVDPICTCIAETDDEELRNVAYSIAMQIPQSASAYLNVSDKHIFWDIFIFYYFRNTARQEMENILSISVTRRCGRG